MDRNLLWDCRDSIFERSLSARRAWIEMMSLNTQQRNLPSLSARRAWIEIMIRINEIPYQRVALRKESVDRNLQYCCPYLSSFVALRKESVDRNCDSAGY